MSGVGELADRFFAAISRGDLAEVGALYAPDAVVWHNYDDVEQTREQSVRLLGWLTRRAAPLRYTEVRWLKPDGPLAPGVIADLFCDTFLDGIRAAGR